MTSPRGTFFEGLSPELLDQLLASGIARSYAPGEALLHEKDPAAQFLVILNGQVRVWRTSPRRSAMTVHLLGPGDLPGIAAVVQRTPYPATATAVTPVKTLGWSAEHALSMLFDHPMLATNTMRFLSFRNEEMLHRLHEVSTEPVEQRLARAVMRLTYNDARSVDISRQELAELTATTLHTVSRIVSRWESEGAIDAARRRITLIEGGALSDRAEGSMKR